MASGMWVDEDTSGMVIANHTKDLLNFHAQRMVVCSVREGLRFPDKILEKGGLAVCVKRSLKGLECIDENGQLAGRAARMLHICGGFDFQA